MDVHEMVRLADALMGEWQLYEEAATVLRWARELFPDEELVSRRLIEALARSGEEEEARKLSNELGPIDDPDDLVTHALAQAAAFDHEKAIELLDRAVALAPDEESLYARRGLVRFTMGNYEEAALDLVRSLLVSWWVPMPEPDFEPLLRGYKKIRSEVSPEPLAFKLIDVWAKLSTKKPRSSKQLLGKIDEEHWAVHALHAVLKDKQERVQLEHVKKALELAPKELALLIRRTRLERDRLELYEDLVRIAPHWTEARVEAAAACLRAGNLDRALEHAHAAALAQPSGYNALKIRAEVLERRGELRQALADLDELVELYDDEEDPGESDWDAELWREELNALRCTRARVRQKLRDLEGARADLDVACSLSSEHSCWPFFDRARFFILIGEREKALSDLDRGLSQIEWPEALGLRSRLREKMGDEEGAKKDRKRRDELLRYRRGPKRARRKRKKG